MLPHLALLAGALLPAHFLPLRPWVAGEKSPCPSASVPATDPSPHPRSRTERAVSATGRPGDVWLVAGDGHALPEDLLAGEGTVLLYLTDDPPSESLAPRAQRVALVEGVRADGEELAAALRAAGVVLLAGGDLLPWWRTLEAGNHPSGALTALLRAHRGGAAVVGVGGAARYLASSSLIPAADLREQGERERNPRATGREHAWVVGLGLVPRLLVDLEDDRGGLPRCLLALHGERAERALVLAGEVAWHWDPDAGRATVVGGGSALLVDLVGARRQRSAVSGARLSLLRAGDRWESHRRRVVLAGAEGKDERVRAALPRTLEGPLSVARLAAALERCGPPLVLRDGELELRLGLDSTSRSAPGRVAGATLTVSGLPRR